MIKNMFATTLIGIAALIALAIQIFPIALVIWALQACGSGTIDECKTREQIPEHHCLQIEEVSK